MFRQPPVQQKQAGLRQLPVQQEQAVQQHPPRLQHPMPLQSKPLPHQSVSLLMPRLQPPMLQCRPMCSILRFQIHMNLM